MGVWAAIPAIIGGVQAVAGMIEKSKAKKPKSPDAVDLSTYSEIESRAKKMAAEGLPYASELYRQQQVSTATVLSEAERGSTSSSDLLGVASGIQAETLKNLINIRQQEVAYQQQAEQELTSAQLSRAQAQQGQAAINMQQYKMAFADYQSRMSQSYAAIYGGLTSAAGSIEKYYSAKDYADQLKTRAGASSGASSSLTA